MFTRYWNRYPALLYGLSVLLGFYAAFAWSWILLIPLALLIVPLTDKKSLMRGVLTLLLLAFAFTLGRTAYTFPSLPQEGVEGTATLSISSIQTVPSFSGRQWLYRGTLYTFTSTDDPKEVPIAKNIPYSLSIPQKDSITPPMGNRDYIVKGTLKQTDNGQYIVKVSTRQDWYPIRGSWSLAEVRYHVKQWVKRTIATHVANPYSASFLAGLATGEFDNRAFSFEFGRFGLQHIMAISGFHFSIIAAILSLFLRFLFPKRVGSLILIVLLSGYFLFLGCSPSIMRAWIAIVIGLGSHFIEKRASALNSLGVGLLVILFLDPLACLHIGFQFSFLTTAAILILYSPCDILLEKVFTKRFLSEMTEMNFLNQHGYGVLALFRQGLALSIAVNIIAMPVTLYYFQKFPWMSLLHNLFFPLLVSLAMFLLIAASILSLFFPLITQGIHALNSAYTRWILNFIFSMPTKLDVYLRVPPIPSWVLICYLCIVFIGAIAIRSRLEQERELRQDLLFL